MRLRTRTWPLRGSSSNAASRPGWNSPRTVTCPSRARSSTSSTSAAKPTTRPPQSSGSRCAALLPTSNGDRGPKTPLRQQRRRRPGWRHCLPLRRQREDAHVAPCQQGRVALRTVLTPRLALQAQGVPPRPCSHRQTVAGKPKGVDGPRQGHVMHLFQPDLRQDHDGGAEASQGWGHKARTGGRRAGCCRRRTSWKAS